MEQEGLIGPPEGAKPREILIDARSYFKEKQKVKQKSEN